MYELNLQYPCTAVLDQCFNTTVLLSKVLLYSTTIQLTYDEALQFYHFWSHNCKGEHKYGMKY